MPTNGQYPVSPAQMLRQLVHRLQRFVHTRDSDHELADLLAQFEEISKSLQELNYSRLTDDGASEQTLKLLMRRQDLFDFAADACVETDRNGIIREANHAASALLRTPLEFLIDKPFPFFIEKGYRHVVYDIIA